MYEVLHIIDPNYSFWDVYPEWSKIEEFASIKKKYKNSSDVMWFIVNTFYIKSKFRNLDLEERVKILGKDILKDKDFYKDNRVFIEAAINMFLKLTDTPANQHLRQWEETLNKRTRFLKSVEYDLENFDKVDKMATNSAAIFKTLDTIKTSLNKEEGAGIGMGGKMASLADSEEI